MIVYAEFDNLIEINGLREVVTDFQKQTMNTQELRSIFTSPPLKSLNTQVCAKDELPEKKPLHVKAYIVNTNVSDDPGQYWMCLYFDGDKAVYFDSYGFTPLKDHVLPFIKNNPTCWIENTKMIQSPWSNVCGMYCLFVLYQLKQGSNLQNILQLFSEQN